jgi:GNAT superfamily N-acetyltransferase
MLIAEDRRQMLIRDARPDDLEGLLHLLDEDVIREAPEQPADPSPYRAALDEILGAEHSTVLVGEQDGRPVATAQVTWQRRLMYGGGLVCQIESVRVLASLRNRGLGAQLIDWIVAEARRRGCARVELTSNAQRVDARRFYERLGFTGSHVGFKLYLGGAS